MSDELEKLRQDYQLLQASMQDIWDIVKLESVSANSRLRSIRFIVNRVLAQAIVYRDPVRDMYDDLAREIDGYSNTTLTHEERLHWLQVVVKDLNEGNYQ